MRATALTGTDRNHGMASLSLHEARSRFRRGGLPGGPDNSQSRNIEASIDGMIVGCLYLPNSNPVPGPKFRHKLDWLQRLHSYAHELRSLKCPSP